MNPAATAKGLRALATHKDAAHRIAVASRFSLDGRRYPKPGAAEDRCVPLAGRTATPADLLSAMELIDDACDFERIASKLTHARRAAPWKN